ncbi:MAG: OB-fold protein, partial [Bacteroidota bacterium]
MKNRPLLFVLAILAVGLAATYAYLRWNQAPESIVQKETEHRLEANQLLEAFQNQASQAQPLYLNRVLEINGLCQSVENQGDSLFF